MSGNSGELRKSDVSAISDGVEIELFLTVGCVIVE